MHPWEIFWILTPQSPLSWISESFRQDINFTESPILFQISTWKVNFYLCIFFIKNILPVWKIRPIYVKPLETGVDLHLNCLEFIKQWVKANHSKSVLNPHNYRSVYNCIYIYSLHFLLNWLPFLILQYFDRISIDNK